MELKNENSFAAIKIRTKLKSEKLLVDKRKRIMQGALSVFKQKGYHKTTVRDIAKAAKISMGCLYDCISTKEDVLYLFYKIFFSTYQQKIISLTQGINDPRERLKVAYKSLIDVYFFWKMRSSLG